MIPEELNCFFCNEIFWRGSFKNWHQNELGREIEDHIHMIEAMEGEFWWRCGVDRRRQSKPYMKATICQYLYKRQLIRFDFGIKGQQEFFGNLYYPDVNKEWLSHHGDR